MIAHRPQLIALLGYVLLVVLLTACGQTPSPTPVATTMTIAISAPAEAIPLLQEMSDTFAHSWSGLQVQISDAAIPLDLSPLRSGHSSIIVATRALSDAVTGIMQTEIARQPIAVIVHADNPLKNLSLAELGDIYTGRMTEWSKLGGHDMPIQVFSREPGAAIRHYVDYALISPDSRLTPNAIILPSDEAMGLSVARRPEGIGYIAGTTSPAGTRILTIEGKRPSSVARGQNYPLWQPIILLTPAQPSPEVSSFLSYVKGKQGQRLVSQWGYGQGASAQ